MLQACKRPRRCADPQVSTADICSAIEGWLAERQSRDFSSLFAPMTQAQSWKAAPRPAALAELADLFIKLVSVAPNGSLPPKKTALSLVHVHSRQPINFTAKPVQDGADDHSAYLRIGFKKYVECLSEPIRSRTLNKVCSTGYA